MIKFISKSYLDYCGYFTIVSLKNWNLIFITLNKLKFKKHKNNFNRIDNKNWMLKILKKNYPLGSQYSIYVLTSQLFIIKKDVIYYGDVKNEKWGIILKLSVIY